MGAPQVSKSVTVGTSQELARQLDWVRGKVDGSRGLVYFPPSIGWYVSVPQRPHHLARALASYGFVVVFDSTGSRDPVFGFYQVEPGVFLFSGPRAFLQELPMSLAWCFVYNLPHLVHLTAKVPFLYDIIDDLRVFPYPLPELTRFHNWGLRFADAVICVSRPLWRQALTSRADALYLPNGVEPWRFSPVEVPMPADAALEPFLAQEGPVVGYYGSFSHWFAYDFLLEVVRLLPSWRFLFLGPFLENKGRNHPLWQQPQVFYLGPRDYARLPFYLQLFHVATIPFQGEDVLAGLSPLKLYEYLAGGKPVVVTPFPEAEGLPGVFPAATPEDFARALTHAASLSQQEDYCQKLREFAAQHAWSSRVEELLGHLEMLGILKPGH